MSLKVFVSLILFLFYGCHETDLTWSHDGTKILFARGNVESNKLFIPELDGDEPGVNETVDTGGCSDWSLQDLIAFDMGGPFPHDFYTINKSIYTSANCREKVGLA